MTIQQFNWLNQDEQETAVWDYGRFLINFDEDNILCDIYEVSDFYVSFSYELNKNLKAKIVAALHPDDLPYINKIRKIF